MDASTGTVNRPLASERALVAQVTRSNPWWFVAGLMIVGGYLRLSHLGDLGIHSDEDISWITAKLILKEGVPEFPSGLMYMRGVVYLYLTAASVWLLWALRIRHTLARRAVRAGNNPAGLRFRKAAVRCGRGTPRCHVDHVFTLGYRDRALRADVCGVWLLFAAYGSVHLGISRPLGASRGRDPVHRPRHLQHLTARARLRDRSHVPDSAALELGRRTQQSRQTRVSACCLYHDRNLFSCLAPRHLSRVLRAFHDKSARDNAQLSGSCLRRNLQ